VLEVVCLTCQETTLQTAHAPVLLALLLQRAAPGVRAAFLNSADGTRLLVALQQMGGQEASGATNCQNNWVLDNFHGALSLPPVPGAAHSWTVRMIAMAASTLAWCFLEAHPDAAAAATAPPPAQAAAGAATGTAAAADEVVDAGAGAAGLVVMPPALAHGSVLTVRGVSWGIASEWCLLY
jgi:hypothetical protein